MAGTVRIYTDGAYSSKHDMGGWGYYVPSTRFCGKSYRANTTNNVMELMAIINGIGYALTHHPDENVCIVTDSKYAITVAQSTREYHLNKEWIKLVRHRIRQVEQRGLSVTFEWIKGHSGDPANTLADWAATDARDGAIKRLALKDAKT